MKLRQISLSLPVEKSQAKEALSLALQSLKTFARKLYIFFARLTHRLKTLLGRRQRREFNQETQNEKRFNLPDLPREPLLKYGRILLIVLVTGAALFGAGKLIGGDDGNRASNRNLEVKGAKASHELNREFSFPIRNGDGEEVNTVDFVLETAELRDEIIVKGQRATSIKGRTFLILTLKITNQHSQAIEIDTRDYMRLSVNGNEEEWLAPDIHNDPVEVQAISTKYTRVGFPINDSDENLLLRVGEINGEKERVELNL